MVQDNVVCKHSSAQRRADVAAVAWDVSHFRIVSALGLIMTLIRHSHRDHCWLRDQKMGLLVFGRKWRPELTHLVHFFGPKI